MQNNHIIRNVQPKDFNEIYLLLEQLWPDQNLNKEDLFDIYQLSMSNEAEFTRCYVSDGKILGFVAGNFQNAFYRAGKLCYVAVLVIDSEHRGAGIGAKLMDNIKEYAMQNNCKAIELESGFRREKAHAFYEKYGFEKTAYTFALELK